jgi:hypothetical protein
MHVKSENPLVARCKFGGNDQLHRTPWHATCCIGARRENKYLRRVSSRVIELESVSTTTFNPMLGLNLAIHQPCVRSYTHAASTPIESGAVWLQNIVPRESSRP